jgi:hypothetical protein
MQGRAMSQFTIIAPRKLWPEIFLCLEPVPQSVSILFRELKPDETHKYPPDIDSDHENWIYSVIIQFDDTATKKEVRLLESRLRTKWPYVHAEKQPLSWLETVSTRKGIAHA